jgi:benzoyl-CoA reductase subunit C
MSDIIDELAAVAQNPLERARRWKEAGGRVIGCFPMYVPEEIIHASGILPITLVGTNEIVTSADRYLQPYLCHVPRSNLDLALKGKLDFLDGIVFPNICDVVLFFPDIWNLHRAMPFQHTIEIAGKLNSMSSQRYLTSEFNRLKGSLEKFTGRDISDDDLRRSIAIYNQNRDLMHKIYQMRTEKPGIFRARDVATVIMTSMLMPKEEHSAIMREFLEKAENKGGRQEDSIRLVVSGGPCDQPQWEILDLIEELGAIVVNDDLYVGRRYFATKVSETIPPIEALAEHYVNDVPCPTKHNQDKKYAEHLSDMAEESNAQGIIVLMVKYCEPYSFAYPLVKAELARRGIPHLLIEVDPPISLGAMRTRLEAFIETLGQ